MGNYKDSNLPINERVKDLISQMTLEEKVAQFGCTMGIGAMPEGVIPHLENGIGEIAVMGGGQTPMDNFKFAEIVQKHLVENTRLGIPAVLHCEALSGGCLAGCTNYPVAIGLGATWDPEKVEAMGDVIRNQIRAVGITQALSPVLDVSRDLRWGRTGECYGENPTLTSEMSVAFVNGIQGNDLKEGIAATAKHFIGYAMTQGGLNQASSSITKRELREVYAKPFEAAIKKANLASVMNSYSTLDHEPIISSKSIQYDLLRNELGFNGVTVSDYMSIDKIYKDYQQTETIEEAGVLAFEAGMDIELPNVAAYGKGLVNAIEQGRIEMEYVDEVLTRVLTMKFELGLFENPYPNMELLQKSYGREEDVKLSYDLAVESAVLLKNENAALPLKDDVKKIAVIGPNADDLPVLFGGYTYGSMLEMMADLFSGEDAIMAGLDGMEMPIDAPMPELPPVEVMLQMLYPGVKTPLAGLIEKYENAEVNYVQGCTRSDFDTSEFESAINLANDADVAILFVGGKNGAHKSATIGECVDSSDIGLPGVQEELVKAIHATGVKTIVIHMNARPLCSPWISENVDAIMEVWHPGQCGGDAIADLISGVISPSGRLTFTSVRNAGHLPISADNLRGSSYNDRGTALVKTEGYVNESGAPLYTFGHGLSYSSFKYDNLKLSSNEVAADEYVDITCDITNTGEMEADEVVQLYFVDRIATMVRPNKELAGFKRITLKSGETKNLCFRLHANQTAFLDKNMNWFVESGDIDVMIGASSSNLILKDEFRITNSVVLENSTREYYADVKVTD